MKTVCIIKNISQGTIFLYQEGDLIMLSALTKSHNNYVLGSKKHLQF